MDIVLAIKISGWRYWRGEEFVVFAHAGVGHLGWRRGDNWPLIWLVRTRLYRLDGRFFTLIINNVVQYIGDNWLLDWEQMCSICIEIGHSFYFEDAC